ncbi:hypothetical protein FOC4_g10005530 [Fusarium odoratissimum]|uniref:Uncharacterized protein n=3 Tax=Fusarium oxysporum species complex TaxID=171631 RepID=N1RYX4_FUSC4|nr:hypothetical protein FOC4_g10005530 [Fusarium odoratissimum]TXB96255.1 hypothetical protein FocTR4_00016208 [Fusarium oxysporum f. sp. cubense]
MCTDALSQRDILNAGIKNCESPCRLVGPEEDILVTQGTILGTVAPILQDIKDLGAFDVMNLYLGKDALEQPQDHLFTPKVGGKEIATGFSYQPAGDDDLTKFDTEGQISHHYSSVGFMFSVMDNALFLARCFAAKQGDVVAVLDGGKVPLVLRKVNSRVDVEGEFYMVVGSTYVHGFMDGEAEVGVIDGWLEKRKTLMA